MRTGTVFAATGFGLLLLAGILAGAFLSPWFPAPPAATSLSLSYTDLRWNADRRQYRLQLEGSGLNEQVHIALVYDLSSSDGVLASLPTFGMARRLEIRGAHGFLANHGRGFQVLDLSDPLQPKIIGHLPLAGKTLDVAVGNDYAFVSTSSGLSIIDVKDPWHPREVAFWNSSIVWAVVLNGGQAFVALGDAGIGILDISDPASPQLVQRLPTRGFCWELLVDSGRLYSAEGAGGLRILQASPDGTWTEVDLYTPDSPADIRAVAVRGDLIGLLDNDQQSLQLLQRSPDGALEPQSVIGFGSFPYQVKFQDDRALVACGREGLQVVDISDPVRPAGIGSINPGGWAWDLALVHGLVLLASGHEGLHAVDPSWTVPLQVLDYYDGSKKVLECFRHGDQMIVGDDRGTRIVSSETGDIVAELGDFQGNAFALHGNILLVGEKKSFTLVDIADPENTRILSRVPLPRTAEAVHLFVEAEIAVLAVTYVGIFVFDIADPAEPRSLTFVPFPDLREASFDSRYCYLADGRGGLKIVDFREPKAPVLTGGVPFTWPEKGLVQAVSVETDGRYVFLGTMGGREGGGVLVIDAEQPENPGSLARIPTKGPPVDLHWSDGRLYVAESRAGVQIVDVRRPEKPRQLSRQKAPGQVRTVTVGGGRLWLGIHAMGIVSVPEPIVIHPSPVANGVVAEISPPAFSGRYSVQAFREGDSALLPDPIFFPSSPPPLRP